MPALDAAKSEDPTALARNLLTLIPNAPSLSLVIRLIWHFIRVIASRDDAQSYLIVGILSRSASQTPEFMQALMQALDLETIFDPSTLDEDILFTLLDASTNPDISRLLKASCDRVGSWTVFEQTLSGVPDADYTRAALKDIGKEEKSFGIWLSCITTHEDILVKIRDAPAYKAVCPLDLMSGFNHSEDITHSEFIAFVRAYIGAASVLAVYAWSESLPNRYCRERTLGVLRLWQEIPGYRAIISPLLLLPQMTFRLECMTIGNDPPTTAGINTESLLFALAANPQNEGNGGAVEELVGFAKEGLDAILHQDRIWALRVAVTVIVHAPENNTESRTKCGDWTVLEAVWGEHAHGLSDCATDVFTRISVVVKQGFSLMPSSSPTIGLEPLLLVTNHSITTSRAVRILVNSVLDTYCADVASHEIAANCAVGDAALVKHACANVLSSLPSTPPLKRLVAISPPTAVLRSPAVMGLTKTLSLEGVERKVRAIMTVFELPTCLEVGISNATSSTSTTLTTAFINYGDMGSTERVRSHVGSSECCGPAKGDTDEKIYENMSPNSTTPADWGQYVQDTYSRDGDLESQNHSTSDIKNAPAESQKRKRKLVAEEDRTKLKWVAPHTPGAATQPSSKYEESNSKLDRQRISSKRVIVTKKQPVFSPDGGESVNPDTEMGSRNPVSSPADSLRSSDSPSPPPSKRNRQKLVRSNDSDSDERTTQVGINADFGTQDHLQRYAPTPPPKQPMPRCPPIPAVMTPISPIVPLGTVASSLDGGKDRELFEAEVASSLDGGEDRELFEAERQSWAEEITKLTLERVRLESKARAAEKHTKEVLDKEREKWSQERAKWEADRTEWKCERKKWFVERTRMIERREALAALMKTSLEDQMKAIKEYVLYSAAGPSVFSDDD
ncbi:hypothetical protein EDD22DRAFT_852608 [Suillus occidentalis]|nr:hypothetical protein EDD22DRAFT_852608 [Suillus occidentalis]